jgi:putative component of membrane protein insertase Oxa1/YidC/SpoIIIJ protein YidD
MDEHLYHTKDLRLCASTGHWATGGQVSSHTDSGKTVVWWRCSVCGRWHMDGWEPVPSSKQPAPVNRR